MAVVQLAKQPVVPSFAVSRIADDRVGNMFHMPAQLMTATGDGFEFNQRIAAARVTIHLREFRPLPACGSG